MLSRHFITFWIVVALWSSTSAQIFTINGQWNAEVRKCANTGDDSRIYNHTISDSLDNFTYRFFKFDTTIKAGGIFELKTAFTDDLTFTEWPLDQFDWIDGVKSYKGELRVDGSDKFTVNQVAFWRLTLSIQSNGSIEMQNYVHAGSWGSIRCASAKSFIDTLTIAN